MEKILITGASGFIGSFLVEQSLKRELEVYAGIRASSSRKYLGDERINIEVLDLGNPEKLLQSLENTKPDYIVHSAGITKARQGSDFFAVNRDLTKNLLSAIEQASFSIKKLTFISSLAATGPADYKPRDEQIEINDEPRPVTLYGRSKLAAEKWVQSRPGLSYVIVRPTAVFGPRDKDILTVFKLINNHLEPYLGFHKQDATFIYVEDLVSTILDLTLSSHSRKIYNITDGNVYSIAEFNRVVKIVLKKRTLPLKIPLPLVKLVALSTELVSGLAGKYPAFNREKLRELAARNWKCNLQPLVEDVGFKPEFTLEEGVRKTASWYRKEGWI